MIAVFVSLFVFVAGVAVAAAATSWRTRSRPDEARLRELQVGEDIGSDRHVAVRKPRPSKGWLSSSSMADDLAVKLQRANMKLRVGEFLLIRFGLAAFFAVASIFVLRFTVLALFVAIVTGVIGYLLPMLYVNRVAKRRVARFERQLIDLVPALASAMRSGFAFQQALEVSMKQLDAPLADELEQVLSDVNLGATMEVALLGLGRRIESTDLDMIITAIVIQRTTGGNLSEVLDQAGRTMDERDRVRNDVMTLTAQQRLTGLILSVYPVIIGLVLFALMPDLWSLLFTEPFGQAMLGAAVTLQLMGFVLMQRVLRVDF